MPEIQPVLSFKPEFSMSINAWFGIIRRADSRLVELSAEKREFTSGSDYDLKQLIDKNVVLNHTASIKLFAGWIITKLLVDVEKTKEVIEAHANV